MSNFQPFGAAFAKHFDEMSKHELFRVEADGQMVWDKYLDSFPEGTNEIYRVRREHDGSYDRNVIRRIGNVVALIDGKMVSVWDLPNLSAPYDTVAAQLSEYVKSFPVVGLFRIKENKLGYVSTTERLKDGSIKTWNHFHVNISAKHFTRDVDTVLGNARTTVDMFKRASTELKIEALDSVLELINENSLYKGAEFKAAVTEFRRLFNEYNSTKFQDQFLWSVVLSSPAARFKNTVIGTLVSDLSEGIDLEQMLEKFKTRTGTKAYQQPTV